MQFVLGVSPSAHAWSVQADWVKVESSSASCDLMDGISFVEHSLAKRWVGGDLLVRVRVQGFRVEDVFNIMLTFEFIKSTKVFNNGFWVLVIWIQSIFEVMLMAIEVEIKPMVH